MKNSLLSIRRSSALRSAGTDDAISLYCNIGRQTDVDIYSSSMQMEDAVNEGVLAIMRGIDSYDPDKNVKFSTYISPRIKGVMLDYMRKQKWMQGGTANS